MITHTVGMDEEGEREHVAGCSSCQSGETNPFRCSERLHGEIERRAAFYGRTWDEELNSALAVAYEQREPDGDDADMSRRLRLMHKRGQLPSQLLTQVAGRLAAIDRLPDGAVVPCPTTVKEVCEIYLEYKLKGRRSYANVHRTVRHSLFQISR